MPIPGDTLNVTTGTWTGNPTPVFTYAWNSDGAPIAATTASYTLVDADVGATISATVTATNSQGTASEDSNEIGPVDPAPPFNSVAPALTGTPVTGNVLTSTDGTWTGSPAFTYSWLRNGSTRPGGITANSLTLTAQDEGATIACVVTGTDAGGAVSANSNTLGPVLPLAPTNTVPPAVTGTDVVGDTLTTDNGTWTGTPTFTYAWNRDGTPVGGETANTYVLAAPDVGATITSTVTGGNAGGSASANSNAVGPILPLPPINNVLPAITDLGDGTFAVGNQLICTNGTWTGSPTYSRQWTSGGADIAGETGINYTVAAADVGNMIGCTVTGTNAGGGASADATEVGPVP